MTPPHALCNLSVRTVEIMYFRCFGFRGEIGFLNCDYICMSQVFSEYSQVKSKRPRYITSQQWRNDRLHKAGGGLITLIGDNMAFATADIPSTISTHNTELQMVKVHIGNTKHSNSKQSTYLLETLHPHTAKQQTPTYSTAYSTPQTYHTHSLSEMWTHTPLYGTRTLMIT